MNYLEYKLSKNEYDRIQLWLKAHTHNQNVREVIRLSKQVEDGINELKNWDHVHAVK